MHRYNRPQKSKKRRGKSMVYAIFGAFFRADFDENKGKNRKFVKKSTFRKKQQKSVKIASM